MRCVAVHQTRDHVIAGKKVDVKAAVPKSAGGNAKLTKKLFVGGTGQLSDEEFHTHFSQFGAVEDAAVRAGMEVIEFCCYVLVVEICRAV